MQRLSLRDVIVVIVLLHDHERLRQDFTKAFKMGAFNISLKCFLSRRDELYISFLNLNLTRLCIAREGII